MLYKSLPNRKVNFNFFEKRDYPLKKTDKNRFKIFVNIKFEI
jgi:hypothetical protein